MPTTYGTAGTDWGLLTALQGRDNWAQKRQDRALDNQYAQANRNLADNQLQEQLAGGAAVNNIYNEAQKLKVLDPDISKIRDKNNELVGDIKNELKKYNGDINLFLKSGGYDKLLKYKNDLFNSKELTGGVRRMNDYGQMQKDIEEGKILRPITFDENGSKQKYNPNEKASDFLNGKATDFSYNGGYTPFEHDYRKSFSDVYGSGDKYKTKTATRNDVYTMALYEASQKGLNREDGIDYSTKIADEYANGVKDGSLTPYLYKNDDIMDKRVAQANISRSNNTASSSGGRGANNDNIFWIQNVNSGGVNRQHALGYLVGSSNGNGSVIDILPVDASDINGLKAAGWKAASNPLNQNKPDSFVKVVYKNDKDKQTEKIYDLNDAGDAAELQSLKETQKFKGEYIDEWNAYATTAQGQPTETNQGDLRSKYGY